MSNPEIVKLLDLAFERYRTMMLQTETFMLQKDYVHREAFVIGVFKNLKTGAEILHDGMRKILNELP